MNSRLCAEKIKAAAAQSRNVSLSCWANSGELLLACDEFDKIPSVQAAKHVKRLSAKYFADTLQVYGFCDVTIEERGEGVAWLSTATPEKHRAFVGVFDQPRSRFFQVETWTPQCMKIIGLPGELTKVLTWTVARIAMELLGEPVSPCPVLPRTSPGPGLAWQFVRGRFSVVVDPLNAVDEEANADLSHAYELLGYGYGELFLKPIWISIREAERETPTTAKWPWCVSVDSGDGTCFDIWVADRPVQVLAPFLRERERPDRVVSEASEWTADDS